MKSLHIPSRNCDVRVNGVACASHAVCCISAIRYAVTSAAVVEICQTRSGASRFRALSVVFGLKAKLIPVAFSTL